MEEGTVQWKTVVRNFYPDLMKRDIDEAEKELEKVDIQDEVTDVVCEQCGRNMVSQIWPSWKVPCMPWIP